MVRLNETACEKLFHLSGLTHLFAYRHAAAQSSRQTNDFGNERLQSQILL